jgi:hypothetical protein
MPVTSLVKEKRSLWKERVVEVSVRLFLLCHQC